MTSSSMVTTEELQEMVFTRPHEFLESLNDYVNPHQLPHQITSIDVLQMCMMFASMPIGGSKYVITFEFTDTPLTISLYVLHITRTKTGYSHESLPVSDQVIRDLQTGVIHIPDYIDAFRRKITKGDILKLIDYMNNIYTKICTRTTQSLLTLPHLSISPPHRVQGHRGGVTQTARRRRRRRREKRRQTKRSCK